MGNDSRQAQAVLQVFENLGVPLIGAVDELMVWQGPPGPADASGEEAARRFAALLSASISAGNNLAKGLESDTPEAGEQARLKTSALAARLIAQHYILSGQVPDDHFNRRMQNAFDAVLSLADSLGKAETEEPLIDPVAARIEALSPLVQAVMRFPFGQDEKNLIGKFGEDIAARATELTEAFSRDDNPAKDIRTARELAFVKGCAQLLARACEVEMDRIQQLARSGQPNPNPPAETVMANIRQRFEDSLNVLRAVMGFMASPERSNGTQTQSPAPAQQQAPVVEKAPAVSASPMSFFLKKDGADQKTGTAA